MWGRHCHNQTDPLAGKPRERGRGGVSARRVGATTVGFPAAPCSVACQNGESPSAEMASHQLFPAASLGLSRVRSVRLQPPLLGSCALAFGTKFWITSIISP